MRKHVILTVPGPLQKHWDSLVAPLNAVPQLFNGKHAIPEHWESVEIIDRSLITANWGKVPALEDLIHKAERRELTGLLVIQAKMDVPDERHACHEKSLDRVLNHWKQKIKIVDGSVRQEIQNDRFDPWDESHIKSVLSQIDEFHQSLGKAWELGLLRHPIGLKMAVALSGIGRGPSATIRL